MQRFDLKTRIAVFTVALFLCAIWGMAWHSAGRLREDMQNLLASQQYARVDHIATTIDESVKIRIDTLALIANSIRPELLRNAPETRALLKTFTPTVRLFSLGLYVISGGGTGIADYPAMEGRARDDYAQKDYFQAVMKTGRPSVGKPVMGRFSKRPTILIAVPIRDGSGSVAGVLVGANLVQGSELFNGAEAERDTSSSEIYVIHPTERLIIFSTDPARTLKPIPASGVNMMLDRYVQGYDGTGFTVNSRGIKTLTACKRVTTTGWFVMNVLPISVAFAPIVSQQNGIYADAALATLLIAIATGLFVRFQLTPLSKTAKLLHDMTNGHVPLASIPLVGAPEIRLLLQSFNLQQAALREQAIQLEEEIGERQMAQEELQQQAVLLEEEISERIRTEMEREQYFKFFQSSSDLMVIADPNGCFKKINPACQESLGYSDEELLTKPFIDFVHPDDRQTTVEEMARQLQLGFSLNFENRYLCKDGTVRWLSWRANYIEDEGLTYATARDITERKQAEDEISHLKNYLANIIDSMPSMLVGLDRDANVTQWNRRAAETTGIPTAEALGRQLCVLIPEFIDWIEQLYNEVEQRRSASLEKLLIEKQGERRFYDLMLYPLITNGVEGAVVRIEDVTERARIQEMMIQTEKMMSVGGLAAGMAHEINNPLGIITQAVQNIERRVSPDLPANKKAAAESGVNLDELAVYFEQRQIPKFIASIREAAGRASRIIANMLRFSRRSETTFQPASLATAMEQAVELAANDYDLKKKYDFRSIEIVRDIASDMPDIPVVATEIEQVLLNLLKNAAQAMIANPPERKPRIALRLKQEERYAVLEVEDNGPGMAEEVRRRVFEPFFTTKEPGIGTGLGLSVSYMIVTQNHKGLMEVASSPGNGARFTAKLPLSTEKNYE